MLTHMFEGFPSVSTHNSVEKILVEVHSAHADVWRFGADGWQAHNRIGLWSLLPAQVRAAFGPEVEASIHHHLVALVDQGLI